MSLVIPLFANISEKQMPMLQNNYNRMILVFLTFKRQEVPEDQYLSLLFDQVVSCYFS